MKAEIRIVIADDHPIVRQGLKQVIELEADLRVIGEAGDGNAALTLIEELKPDVAILDVDMPHQDGFQVARSIVAQKLPVSIIFLTIHREVAMFQAALDLGAKGYVLKDSAIDDIVTAINEVSRNRFFTSLPVSSTILNPEKEPAEPDEQHAAVRMLTPTEYRILKLLSDYKTTKEIAEELSVSPRTIETHRARICQKLDLHGSHALMRFAVQYKSSL
jgi:DNA-binding NarL/FixJ family response regulator